MIDTRGLDNLIALNDEMAARVVAYAATWGAGRARMNIRAVNAIDTGFMVNTTAARRISRFLWSMGTAAFYGVFIEYGTRYVSARPWLTPAYNEAARLMNGLVRTALRSLPGGRIDVPSGGGS